MTVVKYTEQVTRDVILQLRSDAEVAKVSAAEAASTLPEGEEYIDLEHLDQGVQHAKAETKVTMGHILPRSAVSGETWSKIITRI